MCVLEGGARRGRKPKGSALVDDLEASAHAKERLKAVLDALSGRLTVEEACRRLDLSTARFHEMRKEVLSGALASLEPAPSGRPPKVTAADAAEVAALREEICHLRTELQASRLREEMAIAMPGQLKLQPSQALKKSPRSPRATGQPEALPSSDRKAGM